MSRQFIRNLLVYTVLALYFAVACYSLYDEASDRTDGDYVSSSLNKYKNYHK